MILFGIKVTNTLYAMGKDAIVGVFTTWIMATVVGLLDLIAKRLFLLQTLNTLFFQAYFFIKQIGWIYGNERGLNRG